MADYKWKIEELKKEVKELEEEKELTMNQSRLDFIDEQIVNTKDSIKKLEAYAQIIIIIDEFGIIKCLWYE